MNARDRARAEGFEKCEDELESMTIELLNAVFHGRGSRKCSLEHMRLTTACLKAAVYD